jgi:hypothetical protein
MASLSALRPEFLEQAYQRPVNSVPIVNTNTIKNNNKNDEKYRKIKQLARLIKKHLTKHKTYHLRPVKIDGIYCYVVIHSKYKIVNFESINIKCLVTKNNRKRKQTYSLLYVKYKSIEQALHKIENIVASYKVYNGDLVSPESYIQLKLEETIIPYNEEQVCSICNDNTMDITLCKHYICFHCREQCVLTNNMNCPVCRNEEIINIYNIDNGMINNSSYPILEFAIEYENDNSSHDFINISNDDDDDDEVSRNNSDNDSENEDETIIDIRDNEEQNQQDNDEERESIELIIDRQPQINVIIANPPSVQYDINDYITDTFNLITTNVTRRNREIIEFNNNWSIDHLYNESSDIELQDTNNNRLDTMTLTELSFSEEIEEGELVVNEIVEHKHIV